MKAKIHPQYFENLKITCACGNVVIAGSTKKELRTELCSACHPFYTGKQKLVDTAGRVDKFLARVKKTQEIKAKKLKLEKSEEDELHDIIKEKELSTEETTQAAPTDDTNEKPSTKKTAAKTTKKGTVKKAAATTAKKTAKKK